MARNKFLPGVIRIYWSTDEFFGREAPAGQEFGGGGESSPPGNGPTAPVAMTHKKTAGACAKGGEQRNGSLRFGGSRTLGSPGHGDQGFGHCSPECR
jgi:hypothetical protein